MLIAEKQLRNIIKKILNESIQQERTWTDSTNSAYKYSYNPTTGVVKIVSSPKSKEPVIVDKTKKPKAYDAILAQFNKLPPAAATPPQPVTTAGSTNPGTLGSMATFLSKIASYFTADSYCAPKVIPLWVYPFINFLVLRKTPLVLTNDVYLQSLHRICDIARARGSANLAGPGDIATAQDNDPVYSKDKQGIVGADVSFKNDWSQGYDYKSTNPYMHIAMSLTNFSFSGPAGGPYTFTDNYDFNHPKTTEPPLKDPNYMLQEAIGRSQFLKTVLQRFQTGGVFSGIEDLMRYYEATLNYGGFQITGETVIPEGYVKPAVKTNQIKAKSKK